MRIQLSTALFLLACGTSAAFAPAANPMCRTNNAAALFMSTEASTTAPNGASAMADSGKPLEHADGDAHVTDETIPTKLPSDVGMDYVPLATMLATGQLAEADQVRFSFRLLE